MCYPMVQNQKLINYNSPKLRLELFLECNGLSFLSIKYKKSHIKKCEASFVLPYFYRLR